MGRAQRPPEGFRQPANTAVLAYLGNCSCHSDTGEIFAKAAPSAGLGVYCPEPARYSYVVAHSAGRIVAFAEGMQSFCAHLPVPAVAEYFGKGALPVPELRGWLFFPLFQAPYFEQQLGTLLQLAASTATA